MIQLLDLSKIINQSTCILHLCGLSFLTGSPMMVWVLYDNSGSKNEITNLNRSCIVLFALQGSYCITSTRLLCEEFLPILNSRNRFRPHIKIGEMSQNLGPCSKTSLVLLRPRNKWLFSFFLCDVCVVYFSFYASLKLINFICFLHITVYVSLVFRIIIIAFFQCQWTSEQPLFFFLLI